MFERELFIDGRWRRPGGTEPGQIPDPATGERVGLNGARRAADIDEAVEAAAARAARLGRHPRRRARENPASRRRPDRRAHRRDRRPADPRAGQADPGREKEIRFGVEVIRYLCRGGAAHRGAPCAPSRRSDIRSLVVGLAGRRRRCDRAVELSRRSLHVEGGAGACGGLHAGRQAAARDAAGHRHGGALF